MDNHGMDDHDLDIKRLDDPKWKLLLENPKVRILAAVALGVALGSGATWGMLRTDQPKSAKATLMEQRKADPKIKAQSNGSTRSVKQNTASKKSKSPVKVAKKDTKKHAVTSASAKKKSTAKPATSKADLELFSLAASAINGCEICVQAHEKAVLEAGLTEDNVHDAVRIASTIHAAAVALESAGVPAVA